MTICSHMKCPYCQSQTKIYNSRQLKNSHQAWRRHRCTTCQRTFTTRERIDWSGVIEVITPDGSAPYSPDRLLLSLVDSSRGLQLPPNTITLLCSQVELELQRSQLFTPGSSLVSQRLAQTVLEVLRRFELNLALQYAHRLHNNNPPRELIKQLIEA